MKRVFFGLLLFCSSLLSHDLELDIVDNGDNTILIKADLDGVAVGAVLQLESLITGEVLYKNRFPKDGKLLVDIPKEPYLIVGKETENEDHGTIVKGIEPKEGFSKYLNSKADEVLEKITQREIHKIWGFTGSTGLFFASCIILLILAIYFGIRNTNRILREVSKNEKGEISSEEIRK